MQRFADLRSCCGHRFPLCDMEVRTGNITSCEDPSECAPAGAKQSPAAPTCKGGRGSTLRQSTADPSTPTSVTLTQLFADVTNRHCCWPTERGRVSRESHKATCSSSEGASEDELWVTLLSSAPQQLSEHNCTLLRTSSQHCTTDLPSHSRCLMQNPSCCRERNVGQVNTCTLHIL